MDPLVRSLLAKRIQVMIEPWPRESREYPESLRTVSNHLSELIDRVEHRHERVIVTRNLRAAAVRLRPATMQACSSNRCGSMLHMRTPVLSVKVTMVRPLSLVPTAGPVRRGPA
jgi:prevent-host-death family protein